MLKIDPSTGHLTPEETAQLEEYNLALEKMQPVERVEWSLKHLPTPAVLSSSFGAQAAVSLHMLTQVQPNIPIILIDTGYLFPETYQFIDQLNDRLKLNLQIFRNPLSPAWIEARYGKLWEQGIDGISKYNQLMKVEPMQTALKSLEAKTWFAGLRRQQSSSRKNLSILAIQQNCFKVLPILDWSDLDIYNYLQKFDLPYHPLRDQGYVSIGDTHTTRKLEDGMSEEDTRFFGLKRECGLHE